MWGFFLPPKYLLSIRTIFFRHCYAVMIYSLERKQVLPISIEQAWDFFSRPENLNEITPKELTFKIISQLPPKVYPGLMIAYKVKPFPILSFNWLTEITHVHAPYFFVDEQRIGPYALWHHEHHFESCESGVLMTDRVHFVIPFGIIGSIAYHLLVKQKLNRIFDYRNKVLLEIFPKS